MRNYFDSSDDFFYIINSLEQNVKKIDLISTGWTNFVFEVKLPHQTKIFRFPRNDFFSKTIVKECEFVSSAAHNAFDFSLPNLKLHFDNLRPFSCHEKLEGQPLNLCKLSSSQTEDVAEDICKFLGQLQNLKPTIPLPTCSQFLDDLSLVPGQYDLKKHLPLKRLEKEKLVLSHGDFNTGNILISNGHVSGVIDFSFVSLSHPLNDFARLIGRSEKAFASTMIRAYKSFFGEIEDSVFELVQMWRYVDEKYISYIKTHHPEIEI